MIFLNYNLSILSYSLSQQIFNRSQFISPTKLVNETELQYCNRRHTYTLNALIKLFAIRSVNYYSCTFLVRITIAFYTVLTRECWSVMLSSSLYVNNNRWTNVSRFVIDRELVLRIQSQLCTFTSVEYWQQRQGSFHDRVTTTLFICFKMSKYKNKTGRRR